MCKSTYLLAGESQVKIRRHAMSLRAAELVLREESYSLTILRMRFKLFFSSSLASIMSVLS